MFCKYCGKEIKDDSVFCPFCGNSLSETAVNQNSTAKEDTVNNVSEQESCDTPPKKKLSKYFYAAIGIIVLAVIVVFGYRIVNERNMKNAIWEDLWDAQEAAITDYYADLLHNNYLATAVKDNCEITKNTSGGFDASLPIEIGDATAEGRRSYYPKIIAEIQPNFFRSKAEITSHIIFDELEKEYQKTKISDIGKDAESNELRALEKYCGENFEITGYLSDVTVLHDAINDDDICYIEITSEPDNWGFFIRSYLNSNSQYNVISSLNNNDLVTIRGTITTVDTIMAQIEPDEILIPASTNELAVAEDNVLTTVKDETPALDVAPEMCYHCDAYMFIGELGAGNFTYGDWVYVTDFWASEQDENNSSATMYCCNNNIMAPDIPVHVKFASADEFNYATNRSVPCNICGYIDSENDFPCLKNAIFCGDSEDSIEEQPTSTQPSEFSIRNTIVYDLTYEVPSGQEEYVWIYGDTAHELTCNTIEWELINVKHSINSLTTILDAENIPNEALTLVSGDYFVVVSSEDVCSQFLQTLLMNGCPSTVMGQGYGYLWGVIN